jgi:hypothetical protein
MKKLTKKQAQIISDIKESIAVDLDVLRDFNDKDDADLVSHCQSSIQHQLSGVSSYIIFSSNGVWDERLSDAYWEIRNMPELKLDYWRDCLNRSVEKATEK